MIKTSPIAGVMAIGVFLIATPTLAASYSIVEQTSGGLALDGSQIFTAQETGFAESVTVRNSGGCYNFGYYYNTLQATFYTADAPTTPIATSAVLNLGHLNCFTDATLTFPTPPLLTAGTKYYFRIDDNFTTWYAGCNCAVPGSDATNNLYFVVHGTDGLLTLQTPLSNAVIDGDNNPEAVFHARFLIPSAGVTLFVSDANEAAPITNGISVAEANDIANPLPGADHEIRLSLSSLSKNHAYSFQGRLADASGTARAVSETRAGVFLSSAASADPASTIIQEQNNGGVSVAGWNSVTQVFVARNTGAAESLTVEGSGWCFNLENYINTLRGTLYEADASGNLGASIAVSDILSLGHLNCFTGATLNFSTHPLLHAGMRYAFTLDANFDTQYVGYGGNMVGGTGSPNLYFVLSKAAEPLEPIVFVPGILGSKLNRVSDGEEVWPNVLKMAIPNSDDYLDDLQLNPNGNQIIPINAPAVVMQELGRPAYGDVIENLISLGYASGTTLFTAPYDWRLDLRETQGMLHSAIQNALANSPTGKINIITHSMGGLLVKTYLENATSTDFIDKVIFAGVPNLGAPKTLKILNYGDDLGMKILGLGLNPKEVKKISQNMPGLYELLPGKKYFTANDTYNGDNGSYVIDLRSGRRALDFSSTTQFLEDSGRNPQLLSSAAAFHELSDSKPLHIASSTKFYTLTGCQNNTIGGYNIYSENTPGASQAFGLRFVDGDGTVPLMSANSFTNVTQRYFSLFNITGADHLGLVQNESTLHLIDNILSNALGTPITGISENALDCLNTTQSYLISSHSPVQIHVYDLQNRHVGPSANGDIELGIPGSDYEIIQDNNFVIVPADGAYRVEFHATDAGKFNADIQLLDGTEPQSKVSYLNIPLETASAKAEINLTGIESGDLTLHLDHDGNGSVDSVMLPSAIVSGVSSQDITPPTIVLSDIAPAVLLNVPISFSYNATDAESGVNFVRATLDGVEIANNAIIKMSQMGGHVLHIEATDNAGNPSVAELSFDVVYDFLGFLPPIQSDGSGVYKQGRTLPVKFQLKDADGSFISDAVAYLALTKIGEGVIGADEIPLSMSNADAGNIFRYDSSSEQYIYNLDTKTLSPGIWQLIVNLDDGTITRVNISVK